MSERLERLLNLTATLLATSKPLTLEEIADRLEPSYPADKVSRRRSFERDKESLREMGVKIKVDTSSAFSSESGYRILPEDYYLPDLGLTEEERSALHAAVTAVRFDTNAAKIGLIKLGGAEGSEAKAITQIKIPEQLPDCFAAVAKRCTISFLYRGEERTLEPYGLVNRFNHWYVVGNDSDKNSPRTFRVDRIEGVVKTGKPGSFEPSEQVNPVAFVRTNPITFGEDESFRATVLIDPQQSAAVVLELGNENVTETHDDGSVVISMDVVNKEAFRTWVLSLLEHATVLSPPQAVEDMQIWLRAIIKTSTGKSK